MIKKILSVILSVVMLMLSCNVAFAEAAGKTYYVDSADGSDANDGLSPESAWKTLSRVNEETFSPGDTILLKRGCTFDGAFIGNGSGSESAPITVSAYGEGNRPVISSDTLVAVFILISVSNWTIENLEFTDSVGGGMIIYAANSINAENITVRNCYFHDICPDGTESGNAAILIDTDLQGGKIRNLHLDSLRIENTAWGIHSKGLNYENNKEAFVSPEENYNSDYSFENLYIKGAKKGGIVVAAVLNCHVGNCRVIDCATAQDSAYAPLWIRHSKYVTIEYCEIAGSTNKQDGMAIDFDGWTTDSTYRYIYSHDNTRFIKNCVFDRKTRNARNEVCNCVSVNDNKGINWSAISLFSTSAPDFSSMKDFSFHDNVIVNGTPILWLRTPKPDVNNVTFIGSASSNLLHRLFNLFSFSSSFSYRTSGDVSSLTEEITKNLPEF